MRFKTMVTFIFMASLSVFASSSGAQEAAGDPPAQGQRQPAPGADGGPGMMSPEMVRRMAEMMGRGPGAGEPGLRMSGPLQRVSRLLAALDDPRVRTMLGLTDQQADGLRKIVVDTETFTIKTGADIAVDSIDLREQLRADKPDRATVTAQGDEISKDTSQLINHYLDAILAAKAILTPQQQKLIRMYMENGAPGLPQAAPSPRPRR